MNPTIREERLKIPTVHGGQIFLRQLGQLETKAAVLMVHGLGTNGDAYIKEGHGLANYLSELGFSCFIPDLIGHGQSWPHISRHLEHSVHDIITEDLVRVVAEIERQFKGKPLFLIGQGFGSVLLMSAFARHKKLQDLVQGCVHFNARRSVAISGVSHSGMSKLLREKVLPLVASVRGDVPMQWLPEATQPEVVSWYKTFLDWSVGEWRDPVDGFNYGSTLRTISLPPGLYFAARSQGYSSNTGDIREFMRELGTHNARMMVLAKRDGNLRNYNSMTMIQHDDAWVDHFPVVLDWLNERIRQVST